MPLTFKGGVHPPDKKELAKDRAIKVAQAPKQVVIPLSQHIGAPCKPAVEIGQQVKKGEVVGTPQGFVSAPVHASVSRPYRINASAVNRSATFRSLLGK